MKKGTAFVVSGLLTACLIPMSLGFARETARVGTASFIGAGPAVASQQAAKTDDEIAADILARKGKTYRIDVSGAAEEFDINPRTLIIKDGVQFYPQGLIHVIFGGLKLESKEVPMLYRMRENVIEWVDTEAKAGEKGYELKFESQDGGLYKGVTLTTSAFTMTAKTAKIEEAGDKVNISIID